MPKALDLTNQKFGFLTAIEKAPSKNKKTYWKCRCDCGNETIVQTSHLRNGSICSCGCRSNQRDKLDTETKKCLICQKEFIPNNSVRVYCYDCVPKGLSSNEAIRAKARAFKHHLILYKGGKCEKCGYDKCEGALQFHHRNPVEKEFTISDIVPGSKSIEDCYKELDKCSLLCANCHAEEHWLE